MDLLAVASEDEEGVVDGDSHADERGQVGRDDVDVHHLRDGEDERSRHRHRSDRKRERQASGGQRSEHHQQDHEHDGQPDRLGRGEVLLQDVGCCIDERGDPDHVCDHAVAGLSDLECLSHLGRDVRGLLVAGAGAEADDNDTGRRRAQPELLRAGRDAHRRHVRQLCLEPADGSCQRGRAGAGLCDQDRCELSLVGVREVTLDGASHDVRPGAGDVEAAPRQVLGLAQRERDRDHDDHEPQYGDQPTAPLEESRQPERCPLHRSTVPL